jgi:general secretion pathway protein J
VSRPRAGGFTLLELLIAMSLISLILVLMYGGLQLGSRNWDSIEQKVRDTEEVRLARGFLQRALLQARNRSWEVDQRMYPVFFGGDEQLEFITPLSTHVGVPGLYVLRVAVVAVGDRKDLILQRWLFNPQVLEGADEIPEWRPMESPGKLEVPYDGPMGAYGTTLLLRDVGALELSYFGIDQGEKVPDWHPEWMLQLRFPQLVKIGFGEDSDWPDLIVPLADG